MRSRKIRDEVVARDGCCVLCGRSEGLDVHHLDSFGAHGQDIPERMVTLCRVHHGIVHTHPEWHAILEEYLARITCPGYTVNGSRPDFSGISSVK